MEFSICDQKEVVGKAIMVRSGLYADIQCDCQYPAGGFYRVYMKYSDKTIDLGLWIKDGSHYLVRRRIPLKSLGEGDPVFYIAQHQPATELNKYPLQIGQPFENIEKIRKCKLLNVSNTLYLVDHSAL